MLKAYKYKIKPNTQQQELLSKFFGCVRYIYNWGLNAKTSAYKENGIDIKYGASYIDPNLVMRLGLPKAGVPR